MPERLGDRIGWLRTALGLTQAELAARVAISRVALSNLESGRSVPGERTVTLLAGVFHLEPLELVDGTAYPASKAERLPAVTARHTELELQLALLDRDLRWLEGAPAGVAARVTSEWRQRLAELAPMATSVRDVAALEDARRRVADVA
ncbi:helix-turn-helix domain-containing protein [Dermatobacter hominis]|uniref:helix-turn-helix domain-containing protein n=1 Tax=Dermatobacter hominis TaxID=2884263 RepID=UPI001D12AF43|nr:helix-turn-helix transcriptional regulator [Dermatobacter hominis]UDY35605.1 helix-turn-helix domain-containing protein [Dermatobacter hominis]